MKRRNVLSSLGMLALPRLSDATSIYGTPVSVSGPRSDDEAPLRLLLTTIDVPDQAFSQVAAFAAVWDDVLSSTNAQARFQHDPELFFRRSGIPREILNAGDQEVMLLKALCDPEVLAASMSGNYSDFLARLATLGLTNRRAQSGFKRQVLKALRASSNIVASPVSSLNKMSVETTTLATQRATELSYLYAQLLPSIEQVAMAAVPVAIAAIVVVYVSVAAAVTVGILAGVYISVAVATAITIGGKKCEVDEYPLLAGPMSALQDSIDTQRRRDAQHSIAHRELIGKRMLSLGPARLAEAQQIARLSKLLRQDKFVLETNRRLVTDEADAFIHAAEAIGLLTIPDETRAQVIASVHQISLKAAALD